MSGGIKHDGEKPMIALLSPKGVTEEAKGMTYGKSKYGMHNWRKGIEVSRYLSAALRHIFQHLAGETIDEESGVMHLGLAKCNLGMAIQTLEDYPDLDDRHITRCIECNTQTKPGKSSARCKDCWDSRIHVGTENE